MKIKKFNLTKEELIDYFKHIYKMIENKKIVVRVNFESYEDNSYITYKIMKGDVILKFNSFIFFERNNKTIKILGHIHIEYEEIDRCRISQELNLETDELLNNLNILNKIYEISNKINRK